MGTTPTTLADPRRVVSDIGLSNDLFVTSMISQDAYTQPSTPLGDLINQFPEAKRTALLNTYASDDTIQAYLYGQLKLWLKESALVG